MTLTDCGPLLALIDRSDGHHAACVATAAALPAGPLVTTWPCFTETMYLLGSNGGFGFQEQLWRRQQSGQLILLDLTIDEIGRMLTLMRQYADRPMDLADASLVAVAESRNFKLLFTLDSDFRFYRLQDGSVLEARP